MIKGIDAPSYNLGVVAANGGEDGPRSGGDLCIYRSCPMDRRVGDAMLGHFRHSSGVSATPSRRHLPYGALISVYIRRRIGCRWVIFSDLSNVSKPWQCPGMSENEDVIIYQRSGHALRRVLGANRRFICMCLDDMSDT